MSRDTENIEGVSMSNVKPRLVVFDEFGALTDIVPAYGAIAAIKGSI
jgi:hypothetical protein